MKIRKLIVKVKIGSKHLYPLSSSRRGGGRWKLGGSNGQWRCVDTHFQNFNMKNVTVEWITVMFYCFFNSASERASDMPRSHLILNNEIIFGPKNKT